MQNVFNMWIQKIYNHILYKPIGNQTNINLNNIKIVISEINTSDENKKIIINKYRCDLCLLNVCFENDILICNTIVCNECRIRIFNCPNCNTTNCFDLQNEIMADQIYTIKRIFD